MRAFVLGSLALVVIGLAVFAFGGQSFSSSHALNSFAASASDTKPQDLAVKLQDGVSPTEAKLSAVNQSSDNADGPDRPERQMLASDEVNAAYASRLLPASAKSLLVTYTTLKHGDYMWRDGGVADGPVLIWIDLRRQMISVFRDGHEIGTAVIAYGTDDDETPLGRFPIKRKYRDYHSRKYDAPMPYSLFITNTGVALHGSPMERGHVTHGCIGLPVGFARKLFEVAKKGDIVQIVRSKPKIARRYVRID